MKTYIKKAVSFMLAMVMAISMAVPALAAEPTVEDQAYPFAQALYEVGLFRGTGTNANGEPEFDLGGVATRAQAIVMLVRILGKEAEAIQAPKAPFTDVPIWAVHHVNYAYAHGLTSGTSATTFGSSSNISNTEYLTFCLRALGYGNDDFQWDKAYTFAQELGLIEKGEYENANDTFKRADAVLISYATMTTPTKGSTQTLAEQHGVFLREVSRENQLEQPVMPTAPTLPKIVTDRISFLDESTEIWYPNNLGTMTFDLESVGFGTILKGLTEYQLDKSLTATENFKRLNTVYNSYNTNCQVSLINWTSGNVTFSVGRTKQGSIGGLPTIAYGKTQSRYPEHYTISKEFGNNWETGIPKNASSENGWGGVEYAFFLNTLCFADYNMGQQVFMMMHDYYYEGTAKVERKFKDKNDYWSQYAVYSGDYSPITKEFVEKYGLTYIKGEFKTPWLEDRGKGNGDSYVVVSNGIKTWRINYDTPNWDCFSSCVVILDWEEE